MLCSSCKEKLETKVKSLPEVETVSADVKAKTMTVSLKSTLARATLVRTLKDAGFEPM